MTMVHANTKTRAVYRHADLSRVFAPRSICVVGASARAGSFGNAVMGNLARFAGSVTLVNPRYKEIDGRTCYPSVRELPESPDCVVVAVGRDDVEAVVLDCAHKGAGGAIVFASGYAESGRADRIAMQQRLSDIARDTGLKIVGPNCLGVFSFTLQLPITFTLGLELPAPNDTAIGLASQSGAMGNSVAQASRMGVSFSHLLTAGNSCDVDTADNIAFLAEEPSCKVVACIFEGTSSPKRLIEAAGIVRAQGKPLLVCKVANSERGAASALSHTGVLAGSAAAYRAMFERVGAVVVEDLEELAETAAFFAKAPAPNPDKAKRGVAVVAGSGGFCIAAADKAEKHAVPLPQPGAALREELARHVPEFGFTGNPCDFTAQITPDQIRACCDVFFADPGYDSVVMPHTFAFDRGTIRITNLQAVAAKHGKIGCVPWTSGWLGGPGSVDAASAPNLALFRSIDSCFRTLAAWYRHAERSAAIAATVVADSTAPTPAARAPQARQRVAAQLREATHPLLSERASKAILAQYGLPVVAERLAASADEAIAIASDIGYPVVLKIEAAGLAHKTESGLIRLNVQDIAAVRAQFEELMAGAAQLAQSNGQGGIAGVLVQPMIGKGVEVMAGIRVDPLFGPLVLVGLGGIFVEVLEDVAVDLAPVTPAQALDMLGRLKSKRLLEGYRGTPAVDLQALARVVANLSEFAADHADSIAECDINPLICNGSRILAVDALIVRPTMLS